jgi:hypothetical protein
MQADVERRRCAKRVVDTHTSPARVACLFNARPVGLWNSSGFSAIVVSVQGGRQEGQR